MYNPDITEDFSSEYEKTKKALESLNFETQQKKTLLSQGKPLSSIDASIREKIRKIEATLKSLNGILKDWELNPDFYNMTLREVERRRNKIQELNNMCQEIKTKAFENDGTSLSKEREKLFKEGQIINNTKKLTVDETIANQKQALKNQDEQIGNLLGNVQNIKVIGKNIGQEIGDQNVILEDLNKNIDKNVIQMEKTSTKFTRILENSSTWKLFVAIGIEIVVLILIILFA